MSFDWWARALRGLATRATFLGDMQVEALSRRLATIVTRLQRIAANLSYSTAVTGSAGCAVNANLPPSFGFASATRAIGGAWHCRALS